MEKEMTAYLLKLPVKVKKEIEKKAQENNLTFKDYIILRALDKLK